MSCAHCYYNDSIIVNDEAVLVFKITFSNKNYYSHYLFT